jgi:diadenosine tetraphosphate (Ap4A) HIT family hydrolase
MNPIAFDLDPRLAADTAWICDWPLSTVLLMRDSRYAWLILVPRAAGASEIFDLPPDAQARLWQEVTHAAELLKALTRCRKINVGALGNVVAQLHVHVVAREAGDFAGNGPVWGQGAAVPYAPGDLDTLLGRLRATLRPPGN